MPYIDSVILTDRNQMDGGSPAADTPWGDAVADSTCETRTYLLQNWRADTSVIMNSAGAILQRIKYSPYGKPESLAGIQDFNKDGLLDFTDFDDFVGAFENGEPAADVNGDGFIDFTDADIFQTAFEDTTIASGGREIRKLWAGYEAEPGNGFGLCHVRHRVYSANLGAWTRRDPLGYVDVQTSMYEYAGDSPINWLDSLGLQRRSPSDGDFEWPSWHPKGAPPPPPPPPAMRPPTFTGPGWTPALQQRVTNSYSSVYQRLITLQTNYNNMIAGLTPCVQRSLQNDPYASQMIRAINNIINLMNKKGTNYYTEAVSPLANGDPREAFTDNDCQTLGFFGGDTHLNNDTNANWSDKTNSGLDTLILHELAHRPEGWRGDDQDGTDRGDDPHQIDDLASQQIEAKLASRVQQAQQGCGERPTFRPPPRPR